MSKFGDAIKNHEAQDERRFSDISRSLNDLSEGQRRITDNHLAHIEKDVAKLSENHVSMSERIAGLYKISDRQYNLMVGIFMAIFVVLLGIGADLLKSL